MTKGLLPPHEVERIVEDFAWKTWNSKGVIIQHAWLSSVGGLLLYEIDGVLKIHQLTVPQGGLSSSVPIIDTIVEYSFKLQVSASDGAVVGHKIERLAPASCDLLGVDDEDEGLDDYEDKELDRELKRRQISKLEREEEEAGDTKAREWLKKQGIHYIPWW